MIDYASRVAAIQSKIADRHIGLLYLPPGANLFYLTGIRRQEQGGTDHNAYRDYIVGGYLGPTGGGFYRAEAQDKRL